jgi:hypothetical protein
MDPLVLAMEVAGQRALYVSVVGVQNPNGSWPPRVSFLVWMVELLV